MWPSSMPAMASRAASLASAWITDAPPSAFGSRMASGLRRHDGVEVGVGQAGGDAVDAHQQARALRLRHRVLDEGRGARARGALRSGAIESSRSTIMASAPLANALSSFEPPSAGTKSRERMIISLDRSFGDDDRRAADACGGELAALCRYQQFHLARPPHFITLLDHEPVLAVAERQLLRAPVRRTPRRRSRSRDLR